MDPAFPPPSTTPDAAPVEAARIEVRDFRSEDAAIYRRLNEEWISQHFGLEDHDRKMLEHPQETILGVGGRIFIVTADGTPIGGAAFIPLQGDHYELAKMAVAPEYRGRGIGRKLLLHIIAFARSLGARTVRLGSNRKLTNAIHLYESVGFRHLPPERITPSRYTRTNVFMELVLD